jgi:methionine aminotransferase
MSKLPNVGTTIFTIMSKMANEHGAINLAQGFPNFSIDPRLDEAMKLGENHSAHQYAPMGGAPDLLEAIVKMNKDSYGVTFDANREVLVTAGATQAIFTAIQSLVGPGDEVLILDPAYDCYDPSVLLAGGTPIHASLTEDYRPDWKAIFEKSSKKTKMIIINNPHNPCGTLWSKNDFQELEKLCSNYPDLLVLSDEVYEYIFFEKQFYSIKEFPILKERAICVSSFGKTFHITGWKIGYLTAPEKIMIEIKKAHQFIVFCVNHGAQIALAKYIKIAEFNEIQRIYKNKRDLFIELLEESKFELLPCEGSFFILASYAKISDLPDTVFCEELTKKHGVAAIPISVFNEDKRDDKIIRFCFAKEDATLIEASKRLCKI